MSDDGDLVVHLDPDAEVEAAVRRESEEDALIWSSNVAIGLIVAGSFLGLWFGFLLFAADPHDVLENPLFIDNKNTATVNGQILTALDEGNLTGGDPIEGIQVILLNIDDEPTSHSAYTNRDGRFSMEDVPHNSFILKVSHPGNKTIRTTFNPGDQADLSLTLTPGEGTIEEDIRHDSHLDSAVLLASVVASLTVIAALFGFVGAAEARRGKRYRRTQYLCGLALFSRGGIFIGPMLILAGMGMLSATKRHFDDFDDEN
ncbi:MAG: carboxypeptidase-like regulatory domain-containing protein [Candidatus Thermoplasmatota archaeon]|nr:carboxypeptidase-like regulatory domain-containing protein [Candidatus Thermoplasmatota archaeon]